MTEPREHATVVVDVSLLRQILDELRDLRAEVAALRHDVKAGPHPHVRTDAEEIHERATELVDWVGSDQRRRPDPEDHARAVSLLATWTLDDITTTLTWAWAEDCPTTWWQDLNRLPSDHEFKVLRDETAHPDRVVHVDHLIANVEELVRANHKARAKQITHTWRRNAMAMLHGDRDPSEITAALEWALTENAHFINTVRGMPAPKTWGHIAAQYDRERGWHLDQDGDPQLRDSARVLVDGWTYYLGKYLAGRAPVPVVREVWYRRAHEVLAGTTRHDPLPASTIQELIRWVLDPQHDRLKFHAREGLAFPTVETFQQILAYSSGTQTGPRSGKTSGVAAGVAATNLGATGDTVSMSMDGITIPWEGEPLEQPTS